MTVRCQMDVASAWSKLLQPMHTCPDAVAPMGHGRTPPGTAPQTLAVPLYSVRGRWPRSSYVYRRLMVCRITLE